MFTLDACAALDCPLKVHHSFHPGFERPPQQESGRVPGGVYFRTSVLDAVAAGRSKVTDLRSLNDAGRSARETACLTSMEAGAEVVIGGVLPRDWDAHRSGHPDLLVRDPSGGYYPGVVKHHHVVETRGDESPYHYSELAELPRRLTTIGWRYRWHWRWANSLQLAHLWRLLGPTGHQATQPWGLIIGTDEIGGPAPRATWVDLAQVAVPASPEQLIEVDPADDVSMVTALDRYDFEFGRRVTLAEQASAADAEGPPLLRPIVSYECNHCPWWPVCREQLDDDDLSLRINKSPLDAREITMLRETGVVTVGQLAAKDLDEFLPGYLPQVTHRPGAEDRLRLAQRRSRMILAGVDLERTTSGPIALPAATLEVDIDIETSREDRVYLWGFWVSEGDTGSYHEFSSFTDLDDASERELARDAMKWLRELVADRDALVFHYSEYEVVRLGRLAPRGDEVMDWATEFAADHFVDLFPIVREHFFGTNGLGLKVVASAGAGFHWRDQDPGGLNSMRWFDEARQATTQAARDQARTRILEYNEDDVKATWRLRRWLRSLS